MSCLLKKAKKGFNTDKTLYVGLYNFGELVRTVPGSVNWLCIPLPLVSSSEL